jgi:hypothetical protein
MTKKFAAPMGYGLQRHHVGDDLPFFHNLLYDVWIRSYEAWPLERWLVEFRIPWYDYYDFLVNK